MEPLIIPIQSEPLIPIQTEPFVKIRIRWICNRIKRLLSGFAYNFGGGTAYFIAQNISFDFGVSYTKINYNNKNSNIVNYKLKQGNLVGRINISVFL